MSTICDTQKEKVGIELLHNSVHRKFKPVGDQTSRREDAGMRNMSQRGWAPRPPVGQPRAIRVGVNMLLFCSVSNSLSHTTFSIKWEVYFSKELCRSSLLCRRYDSACICIRVCIVVMAIQHQFIKMFLFQSFYLSVHMYICIHYLSIYLSIQ